MTANGGTILDLSGTDFEFNNDVNLSPNFTITIPVPGVSLTIDFTEAYDLGLKIINSISRSEN